MTYVYTCIANRNKETVFEEISIISLGMPIEENCFSWSKYCADFDSFFNFPLILFTSPPFRY